MVFNNPESREEWRISWIRALVSSTVFKLSASRSSRENSPWLGRIKVSAAACMVLSYRAWLAFCGNHEKERWSWGIVPRGNTFAAFIHRQQPTTFEASSLSESSSVAIAVWYILESHVLSGHTFHANTAIQYVLTFTSSYVRSRLMAELDNVCACARFWQGKPMVRLFRDFTALTVIGSTMPRTPTLLWKENHNLMNICFFSKWSRS